NAIGVAAESWMALMDRLLTIRNEEEKEKLYGGADNMEDSARDINDIYNDALAVYNVTYDHAMAVKQVGKCRFAWMVAGSPLCSLYNLKQDENAFVVSLSVLHSTQSY
ncbi:hypothetical protein HN51_030640, partial [Arachis hypogaea]